MNAENWPAWCDADVWVPTEEDSRWAAEHLNEDYHDLDGHPVIDDDQAEAEAEYWREEERRHAADPTDDDLAEIDPWTDGDDWEADGRFDVDDLADESAWMDSYEQGFTTF